jgi:hypothetical protein
VPKTAGVDVIGGLLGGDVLFAGSNMKRYRAASRQWEDIFKVGFAFLFCPRNPLNH